MITIKVFDNKGKSWDRYTVVIDDAFYGMSTNATSPDGFNQYGGEAKDLTFDEKVIGKEVLNVEKLPAEVKKAIMGRLFDEL